MFSAMQIGIDLGTANLLVYTEEKGMIINEPSVVALDTSTGEVLAVGEEAKMMVGKTPGNITAIRPLRDGVIADYDVTTQLIKHLMKKASKKLGTTIRKPNVVVCTPSGATSVEKRAIQDAVREIGARDVQLIEEPVAAAIGADLPLEEPIANVIVDIGGGTSEVAIISFGGIVSSHSLRIGGDRLDEDIAQYVRKKYHLMIGTRTAEEIKMEIGHALEEHTPETMTIRGRDLMSGLPHSIEITSTEMQEACREALLAILETIKETLEDCPPELSGDIVDRGVTLTGGGALLKGMQEWLSDELIVPVHLAPSPLESVAIGTGRSLKMLKKLQNA